MRFSVRLIPVFRILFIAYAVFGAVTFGDVIAAEKNQAKSFRSVDFNRDIRPILSDKCFHCHGPDSASREADLRLDRESDAKLDRGGYAVVTPGNVEESELIRRIVAEDASERMPPEETGKKLTAKEIDLLKQWIKQDAPWSLAWSYVPAKRHAVPQVKQVDWPRNWIDHFVLARLESEGLKPVAEADKVTLIRRLYIDLTGLPPKPEEVDAFLADERPEAYEQLIDRLLESPHYGERMAMYWLDLVRYADTVGYHGDQDHNISPYRDYVINAFNANMPFDQFTREQLAGDLLDNSTVNQKIATGYNRLLQTSHEGGVQPKEYLAIYAADRVRNLSNVWMGATMGCAQCHDHKFDPYTMKDFYSMQAFFADVDEAQHLKKGSDRIPTIREPEMFLGDPEKVARITKLEPRQIVLERELRKARDKKQNKSVAKISDELEQIKQELQELRKSVRKTMITVSIKPRTIRILPRGNWLDDSGEIVGPSIPEFLGKLDTGDRRATRLDLANWLCDADQGTGRLTARVMANRFCYLLLGVGAAKVLDDLGGQGEPPVHPELLDNLAVEFIDSGWNVKHLMKLIAMSRTYRQSSAETPELRERDPLNRLYARQASFRFPAEVVRDSTLQISGLLVDEQGGASVKPYQPAGYYRHLNFPEREYQAHTDDRQWRRGVYMHWQRTYLHPMLKAFDAPTREECTAERPRSNTALSALVLLNDPTFVEAARTFAARIVEEGGDSVESRLNFAFRQAVSHAPDEEQRELLVKLLESSREFYTGHPKDAEELLSVGLKPAPQEMDRTELAAWTIVARTILSMNETLMRN